MSAPLSHCREVEAMLHELQHESVSTSGSVQLHAAG